MKIKKEERKRHTDVLNNSGRKTKPTTRNDIDKALDESFWSGRRA